MDEVRKLYRVMFKAPATTPTYVVEELEGIKSIENGVLGWRLRPWTATQEFVPARNVFEDFDDADLARSRFQQAQDEYQAKKKRKQG